MKNNRALVAALSFFCSILPMKLERKNYADLTQKNPLIRIPRQVAQIRNAETPLVKTPDFLKSLFDPAIIPIKTAIGTALLLNSTCKMFDPTFLGPFFQSYPIQERNDVMRKIRRYLRGNYTGNRNACHLLIHAGADYTVSDPLLYPYPTLLNQTVSHDDYQTIQLLFERGTSPHHKNHGDPVFWSAKNRQMLQFFLRKGVDINTPGESHPNILWTCITNDCADIHMMQFCLEKGADPRVLDDDDDQSILHYVIYLMNKSKLWNIPILIQKMKLLLPVIPDMINTPNIKGKTPLDCLEVSFNEITELLRYYGAKTSAQLKQEQKNFLMDN